MNDVSLYQYSILPCLFVQTSWNIGHQKCFYEWRTCKYVYRILCHHDINDVFSLRKIKSVMSLFHTHPLTPPTPTPHPPCPSSPPNFKAKDKTLPLLHATQALVLPKTSLGFQPSERKEGWVDGRVSIGMQKLAVSFCCDSEPSALRRSADCAGQYNPQCLPLQQLIKYLMC